MPSFDAQAKFNKIPTSGLAVENTATDLTSPVEGLLEVRTDTHQAFIYLNGVWTRIDNTTGGTNPVGPAGGDLTGTYPNPTIGLNKVMQEYLATECVANGQAYDGGTGTAGNGNAALRALGSGAGQAMAGNSNLNTIASTNATTASVDMGNQKLINLADGTNATDAVTKQQLDAVSAGLDVKGSVKAASVGNMGLGAAPNSLDGVALATNDRVLVKDQTTTSQNGIYVVTTLGTGSNGVWSRATDMDAWTEVPGAFTFVEQGSTNADTGWVCTADQGGTIGSTAITWAKFASAGLIQPGLGLGQTGNTFDVQTYGIVNITGDAVGITTGTITGAYLANGSVDLASAKVTGTLPVGNGGTGGTTAAAARTNLSAAGSFTGLSPALTAGTWATVTHSLGSRAKQVAFEEVSSLEARELDWRINSTNPTTQVDIRTDIAGGRAANYYNVNVLA